MKAAHQMYGGKLIGALSPAPFARMEDMMLKDGLIKRTVPAESLLIQKPGFVEAINRFDTQAVINAAKACRGY
jgi:NitT/TauT family transport system substrate-binding protein